MPALASIILAAGASSRMGRPKQLLHYKGQSLLRRAIAAATDAGCDPVIVVLGCRASEILPELGGTLATPVLNARWEEGIGSSIQCGVEALRLADPAAKDTSAAIAGAVLMLCDQIHVDADVVCDLTHAFHTSGKPVVVSTYADTLGPPIVVDRSLFASLGKLKGDQGAKHIWLNQPEIVQPFPCVVAAVDIDSPADYERLLAERNH